MAEPLVCNGQLTDSLELREVLRAVATHAFSPRVGEDGQLLPTDKRWRGVSVYPLIISIENHCSADMQLKLVDALREELGAG